jgi:hypothetical protein
VNRAAISLVSVAFWKRPETVFRSRMSSVVKPFHSIGNFLTRFLGLFGRSEEGERGPEPGDGAVIHDSSGEADFDGLPGDVMPPVKDDPHHEQPYPSKRSAD